MENLKSQARLLQMARRQANDNTNYQLERWQWSYIWNFFKKQRRLIINLIILLFFQGIVEAALIAISRFWLGRPIGWQLSNFWLIFWLLAIGFFVIVYWALRQEKTFSVLLANSLRRRLVRYQLNRSLAKSQTKYKSQLLAKVYYHLPLASMGVTNSLFGIVRWLVGFLVTILLAYWAGLTWWLVGLFLILFSVAIFFGAYFIARRYISQEVTFYSRLIYYLDNNLSDKEFLKIFHQEGQMLSHFDRLVALDSFFRIRRDVWLKASPRLLFIVLLLLVSFLQLNSGNLLSLINLSDSHNFSRLFLIVYLSRLANEALRIGLYWFPAKLGLYLTIVRSVGQLKFPQIFKIDKTIVFYSPKTKLFQQSAYYRRLSFSFKPGDRILFTGPNLSGKTRLARLLAGQGAYLPKSIHVKIDGRRFNYCQWQEIFGGAYLLDQTLATTEKSLMEFLLGRDKQNIDLADIEKILAVVNKQKIIKDLVAVDGNLNRSVRVIDNHSSFLLCKQLTV